jgi:hypothetical protein
MGRAPTKLDERTRGIGIGLTAGTVGANDDGRPWLDEVRHVPRPELNPVELFI